MPLSEERRADFVEAFDILGKKKAAVDKGLFGVILRSLGQNPTNDEINALFTKHSNGSEIDQDGTVAAAAEVEEQMAGTPAADLKEAFAVFDKEKVGKISAAELRHVIANLGEKVDDDELEEMMLEADKDNNGTIDYSEFVNVLFKPPDVPKRQPVPEHLKPFMKG